MQPAVQEVTTPVTELVPAGNQESARIRELETIIERGRMTFVEVGNALEEIRESRLYLASGFETFDDYCRERWGWSRQHAYRQIAAARVVENLSPIGDTNLPVTESQARELATLTPEDQRRIAETTNFKTATASGIRKKVTSIRKRKVSLRVVPHRDIKIPAMDEFEVFMNELWGVIYRIPKNVSPGQLKDIEKFSEYTNGTIAGIRADHRLAERNAARTTH